MINLCLVYHIICLQFLIPFYIFSHENSFPEYNSSGQKLEKLKAEYQVILERLVPDIETGRQDGKDINRVWRRVNRDSTVSIDKVSCDVPMQFISSKVEIRYLPDGMGQCMGKTK